MEQCRKERIKSNNNKITLNLDPKENLFYKELLSTQPVTQSWVTAPLARHHDSRKRGWHGRVSAENQTLLRCPQQGAALLALRGNWHAQEKVDFTLTLESTVETWTCQQGTSSLLLSLHCCILREATFPPTHKFPRNSILLGFTKPPLSLPSPNFGIHLCSEALHHEACFLFFFYQVCVQPTSHRYTFYFVLT